MVSLHKLTVDNNNQSKQTSKMVEIGIKFSLSATCNVKV